MPRKVWTAAELDEMTPTEVDALFRASIVTDLDEVPPGFLARVRADVEAHIAATESARKQGSGDRRTVRTTQQFFEDLA